MDVYLDNKLIPTSEFSGITIEETVQSIRGNHCPDGTLIVGLSCDGQEVPSGAMTETMDKQISTVDRLDIITATYPVLITGTMDEASEALHQTIDDGKRIAGMLVSGNTPEAIRQLGDCVRAFQQVHDAIGKSLQILQIDNDLRWSEGDSLAQSLAKPREVLTDIKDALQNSDHVRLADILEYELERATADWEDLIERIRNEVAETDVGDSSGSKECDAAS